MSLFEKIEAKKALQKKQARNQKIALATTAAVGGVLVGTVAGVLTAPKSGKETVQDLKEKTNETAEKAKENFEITKTKLVESKVKIKEYLDAKKTAELEETAELTETTEELDA